MIVIVIVSAITTVNNTSKSVTMASVRYLICLKDSTQLISVNARLSVIQKIGNSLGIIFTDIIDDLNKQINKYFYLKSPLLIGFEPTTSKYLVNLAFNH